MKLSVGIPSYQMGRELDRTLTFLASQRASRDDFEVIVSDDGSTDDTEAIVGKYRGALQLQRVFQPRGPQSGRAAARNRGIARARGERLLFIDSGVLLEPDFVSDVIARCPSDIRGVWVHEIVGLFADAGGISAEHFAGLSADTLRPTFDALRSDPVWMDYRAPIFERTHGRLHELSAPWTLGWTCCLTVSRTALGTTRFDETFQGWGAEDCDFSFALQRSGARFFSLRDPLAVHMVHRTAGAETKQHEHVENQLRLHRKAPCQESELFVALGSIRNHLFAERMRTFDRTLVNGRIPPSELAWASERLGPGPRLGAHFLASEAAELGCDVAASCFESGQATRGPTFLIGAQFDGWHARTAILSDTFWILPAEIRGFAMQSVRALAEQIVTLHLAPDSGPDAGFRGRVRSALGWDTPTEALIFERARELELASEVSGRQGGVAIVHHRPPSG